VADVQAACDAFLEVHQATQGEDGMVSLEVSPTLAYDAEGTIEEAQRLWRAVDRPNAMIKIPGTEPGLRAIEASIAAGINVNVTLLFSVERHAAVIEAYLAGLETRVAMGRPIGPIVSVASFFVSRVDSRIDPMLDAVGRPELRGQAAIANARAAYHSFEEAFRGERWEALVGHGARVQRPLWASTSTKDPALPDTYYVEALVGPDTVNTLPPDTFNAYRDHGAPAVRMAGTDPLSVLEALSDAGVSMAEVTRFLEEDGVAKFAASYQSLLTGIEAKASSLVN
jgi:transaldolase